VAEGQGTLLKMPSRITTFAYPINLAAPMIFKRILKRLPNLKALLLGFATASGRAKSKEIKPNSLFVYLDFSIFSKTLIKLQ
jgi:hypothetical protein